MHVFLHFKSSALVLPLFVTGIESVNAQYIHTYTVHTNKKELYKLKWAKKNFHTILRPGSQLLNSRHVVDTDATRVAGPRSWRAVHDYDMLQPRDFN